MVLTTNTARLLFSAVFCITVLFKAVEGHPQCLDYRAPFQVSSGLSFCSQEYSEYGCCTSSRDQGISSQYNTLSSKFSLSTRPKCDKLVKTILCLECHRYAAHIYEAEGNANFDSTTAAPGLCSDFCKNFYQECRDVAAYFVSSGKWKLRSSSDPPDPLTEEALCDGLKLQDPDYCYPLVETIDQKNLSRKYNYDSNQNCLCVEEMARGLRNPLAAVHAGDGSGRLFIAEQPGLIRIIANGKLRRQPFLDLTDRVLTSGSFGDERGFLSIAFHPAFKNNRRFFVYYSTRLRRRSGHKKKPPFLGLDHRTRLSEFKASRYNRDRGLEDSEQVILEVNQPADNHNGGTLFFGSDGYLYLTLGDGGKAGDPFGEFGNGLNRSTLLGSVIRIDVDTRDRRHPYKIPSDNPFIGTPGVRPETFAYGTRNMWRCSVDRGDRKTGEGKGRIFCGDVGQNKYEEIDIIVKGGNYGWRGFEGFECYDQKLCGSALVGNAIPPIFAYNHSVGKSIVGGYVYRGCQNPNLYGKYIFGDTVTSRMFTLTENKTTGLWEDKEICFGDNKYCTNKLSGEFERYILSFGEDEEGELYILSTTLPSSTKRSGKVYRIVDPGRRGDPAECPSNPNVSTGCKDPKGSKNLCEYYKSRNKCFKYEDYFRKKCPKTCGFC